MSSSASFGIVDFIVFSGKNNNNLFYASFLVKFIARLTESKYHGKQRHNSRYL